MVPSLTEASRQPRWVQVALNAANRPAAGWVTTTPSGSRSGKIFPPPTGMSTVLIAAGPPVPVDPVSSQAVTTTTPAAAPAPNTARRVLVTPMLSPVHEACAHPAKGKKRRLGRGARRAFEVNK